MSKKLIAVASAAALALSALVAAPASATALALTISGGDGGVATTAATAKAINVPAANALTWSNQGNTTATAIRVVVTAVDGAALTITSTGGAAKLVTTAQFDATGASAATSATGATSLAATATGGTFTFYIQTTSTTVSAVAVETGSDKITRYFKGVAGLAYTVTATGPAFVQTGIKSDVLVSAKDLFGNAVSVGGNQVTVTYLGNVAALGSPTTTAYRTASQNAAVGVQGTATGGPGSMVVTIADDARRAPADVAGFPDRSFSTFLQVNNTNPVTSLAALQATVTALQAQLAESRTKANSVTKKRYNKLVRAHRALGGTAKLK